MFNKYYYKTYGLNITSDFIFEELFESDGEPEVEILFGKTPNFIAGDTKGHTWFQAFRNNMLVEVDNIARYHICDGNKITIEPKEDTTIEAIKLYLLSVAFASLLQQRKNFPLHGSALNIDGKGIVITGNSGAGKSTLTLGLRQRGYNLVTDDVSTITFIDSQALVNPSYRLQKISQNTADQLGIDTCKLERIEGGEKFYLPIETSMLSTPVPFAAIFELFPCDKASVEIEEINGSEKFMLLIRNTFYLQFVECLELSDEHFKFCAHLASKIKIFRIYRPRNEFTVEEQINLLLNALGK